MAIQVIFGTGPVGLHTAKALLEQGHRVRLVNRTGTLDRGRELVLTDQSNYEVVKADALDRTQVLAASSGASHIYHCVNPLYHQWQEILPPIQENLIQAALQNEAVLAVSENLYMYKRGVPVIDLDSPVDPPTKKGRIRQTLHQTLVEAGKNRGLRWTAVRASDFYGPGATGQSVFGTDRFLDPLTDGKQVALIGKLTIPHSYTYVGDFGQALAQAAQSPKALGQPWIVAHREQTTTLDIAREFREQAGSSSKISQLPTFILKILGLFNPQIHELLEMMYQKQEPYLVSGKHFEKEFNFVPTTVKQGVQKTLEWYRALRG